MKRKRWEKRRSCLAIFLCLVLCFSILPSSGVVQADAAGTGDTGSTTVTQDVTLNMPRIEADEEMTAKQNVTYDCIYFGTYPQAEVVTKAISRNYPGFQLDDWSSYLHDEDLLEDDALYQKLQTATGWVNNRIVIGGVTYSRVTSADADFIYEGNWDYYPQSSFFNWGKDEEGNWDTTTWHYFKHEPIKWRIMELFEVEDAEGKRHKAATLSADRILDTKRFNSVSEATTWENSPIRAWLNDASEKGFMGTAFTDSEIEKSLLVMDTPNAGTGFEYQDLEGADTEDAVYLFSEEEAYGENAAAYGFLPATANRNDDGSISSYSFPDDEARQRRTSLFATAMGMRNWMWGWWGVPVRHSCWWLRSAGSYVEAASVVDRGGDLTYKAVNQAAVGVCPVVNINLDEAEYWSYAGTVSTKDPYPEKVNTHTPVANTSTFHNPIIGEDEDTSSKQKVVYDTVTFGSYPQAEVVRSADYEDTSNLSVNANYFERRPEGIIVDDTLYGKLESANWKDNEAVVDGAKYRRMRSTDAVAAYHTNNSSQYLWSYVEGSTELIDETVWHYFKYEPIRWRILDIEGQKALLFADKVLDTQLYNLNAGTDLTEEEDINMAEDPTAVLENSLNWGNSTVRSWLNGYDGTENRENADYSGKGFADAAFSDTERAAIVPAELQYQDLAYRYGGSVWDGGGSLRTNPWYVHPVSDQVFFLSYADVWKPLPYNYLFKKSYSQISRHEDYGFAGKDGMWGGIATDEALIGDSSTYAKAMGLRYDSNGANWYLMDAGIKENVFGVKYDGGVSAGGLPCNGAKEEMYGIRPALYLDLSKTEVYKDAGIYCTNATVKDAFERIEAESYEKGQGHWPSGKETRVQGLETGSSLLYKNVNFTGTAKSFLMSASCAAENAGTVTLRLDSEDGEVIGTCSVSNTGDWDTMQEFTCDVKETTDLHDLYLEFTYGVEEKEIARVDYFTFSKEKAAGGSGTTEAGGSTGGQTTEAGGSTGGQTTEAGGSTSGQTTEAGGSTGGQTTETGGSSSGGSAAAGGNTITGTGEVGATVTTPDQEYTVTTTADSGNSGTVKYTKSTKKGTLTSVTIPKTVEVAGKSYEVTEVGDSALEGDTAVTQVSIPDTVTKIGKSAFKKCGSLTSVTIPKNVSSVDNGAFTDCTSLTKVSYAGDGVKEIAQDTFSGCTKLKSVTLPKKVTKIGNNAFKKCESLTSVTIPKTVTSVGTGAYADCTGLTKVTYKGDKVTAVANDTFKGCTKLKTVVLPKKVKKIGKNAFSNCKSLKTLIIKSTNLKSIGKNAFKGTSKKLVVKVPAKKKAVYAKMLKKAGFKGTVK